VDVVTSADVHDSFVASNTQENSIYASKETIECILNKNGLETILGRLGACPQMVTHQVIRPIGNGDFSKHIYIRP
jgi:hypothetical protein